MTALKHLVLDVSVIIDLWLIPERAQAIEGLFATPVDAGVCRWVSAASLPTLEFIAVCRFKEQGVDAERARTLVSAWEMFAELERVRAAVYGAHSFQEFVVPDA